MAVEQGKSTRGSMLLSTLNRMFETFDLTFERSWDGGEASHRDLFPGTSKLRKQTAAGEKGFVAAAATEQTCVLLRSRVSTPQRPFGIQIVLHK